mmetsp:Transcript_23406/g.54266  ORF Transcript_23406/g.54266 Transcript_23406/m.54266 type:complete len:245 (+) Transcript_23406:1043-1777(+)
MIAATTKTGNRCRCGCGASTMRSTCMLLRTASRLWTADGPCTRIALPAGDKTWSWANLPSLLGSCRSSPSSVRTSCRAGLKADGQPQSWTCLSTWRLSSGTSSALSSGCVELFSHWRTSRARSETRSSACCRKRASPCLKSRHVIELLPRIPRASWAVAIRPCLGLRSSLSVRRSLPTQRNRSSWRFWPWLAAWQSLFATSAKTPWTARWTSKTWKTGSSAEKLVLQCSDPTPPQLPTMLKSNW